MLTPHIYEAHSPDQAFLRVILDNQSLDVPRDIECNHSFDRQVHFFKGSKQLLLIQAVCDMAFHDDHDRVSAEVTEDSYRIYHTVIKYHQEVNPDTLNVIWDHDDSVSVVVNKAKTKNKEGLLAIPNWSAITESADVKPIWREMQDKWPDMIEGYTVKREDL